MVTSVPSFSKGASFGNALNQGIQGAMPFLQRRQELELEKERQQYQRGILQQGLDETLKNLPPSEQSQLATVFGILKAGAGIPGFDRTLSTVLPQILKNSTAQNAYGNGAQGQVQQAANQPVANAAQGTPVMQQGNVQQVAPMAQQQMAQQQVQNQGSGVPQAISGLANVGALPAEVQGGQEIPQMQGGLLPRVLSTDEVEAKINDIYTKSNGLLNRGDISAQEYVANEARRNQRKEAEKYAVEAGVDKSELPEFMEIGEKFADAKNLQTWMNKTREAYKAYKGAVTAVEAAHIPGYFNRGQRKEMLDRIGVNGRIMKNMGKEQQFRQLAAGKFEMSPLEIEEQLYPESKQLRASLKELPKGRYNFKELQDWEGRTEYNIFTGEHNDASTKFQPSSYDVDKEFRPQFIEQANQGLAQWMKQNIKPDDSLLVIRDKLVKDKDYDWRQAGQALEMAMSGDNPLKLNARQIAEVTEFVSQAPRDSIGATMTGWERPLQRAKGVR